MEDLEVGGIDDAVFKERLEVDQVRISGKGGKALVGGIPVPRQSEGQNLPVAYAPSLEEIDKGPGFIAEDADSLPAGK